MLTSIQPPATRTALMQRAQAIAGWSIEQLAAALDEPVPPDLRKHKGWFGQLLEKYLGASAGSRPEPDFVELNVELKSIPLNAKGQPMESTYVCIVPLMNMGQVQWRESLVWRKLQCVLWVPVEGCHTIPIAKRRLGTAYLWQPSVSQEQQLRQDWEEVAERIATGQLHTITARLGDVLQIRPKAANASVTCDGIAPDGSVIATLPRGFYLRSSFTAAILQAAYA